MRRFRGKAFSDKPGGPRRPGRLPDDGKASAGECDSCGVKLDRAQGYYLATATIVMSESFWRSHIAPLKVMADIVSSD